MEEWHASVNASTQSRLTIKFIQCEHYVTVTKSRFCDPHHNVTRDLRVIEKKVTLKNF